MVHKNLFYNHFVIVHVYTFCFQYLLHRKCIIESNHKKEWYAYGQDTDLATYFFKNSFAYAPCPAYSDPSMWPITIEITKSPSKFYKFIIPIVLGSWKENHQLMKHELHAEEKLMDWIQGPQECKENSRSGASGGFTYVLTSCGFHNSKTKIY